MGVYILGRGVLSPAANNFSDHIQQLYQGCDSLGRSARRGVAGLSNETLKAIEALKATHKNLRHLDVTAQLAFIAAQEAVREHRGELPSDSAVIFGSSRGPTETLERLFLNYADGERLPAYSSPISTANTIPSAIAQGFKTSGMHLYVSGACSTGLHAVGIAYSMIKAGQFNSALAGGVESANSSFFCEAMRRAKVLNVNTQTYPHRPCHENRKGMVLSAGAAALVMGTNKSKALAKIVGYGAATDDGGMTGVSSQIKGLQLAIDRCLSDSGVAKKNVSLVIGHGSSTVKGDQEEVAALRQYFGSKLPPITYHKWLTGHMLGASAASSIAFASEHLNNDRYPNLPYLDHNPNPKRELQLKNIIVLSLGFGGNAAALLLQKIQP